jgi:hypothetical protein
MTLTRLELIATAIAGTWAALSFISRLLHKRRLGSWRVRHRSEQPPFPVSAEAFEQRRNAVQAHIREHSSDDGAATLEFIERPPGSQEVPLRRFGREDPARFWLMSRLHLQLEREQYLLLERVTDAFVCLERLERITPEQFPYLIRLEPLPAIKGRENFPWRVVVACDEPDELFPHFSDPAVRRWLGVGVDFVSRKARRTETSGERPPEGSPPTAANAFGRCSLGGDGLEGTVGGAIEINGELFGVTCRHVLSSKCGSVVWPNPPLRPVSKEFTQDSPDVAFIRLGSGCFREPGHPRLEIAAPASQSDLEEAVSGRTRIRKRPQHDNIDGVVVTAAASGFKLGRYYYRGQHFHVTPYFVRRLGITFPLSSRFSKPGDSGSWVLEQTSRKWFGMIVGGYEPPVTSSVAISAEYISDGFSRYQGVHRAVSGPPPSWTPRAFV